MIKVGLIGAGKRFKNYNFPVLKEFSEKIEVCGIATKSGKLKDEDLNTFYDVPVFDTVSELIKCEPDLLWISVPLDASLPVLMHCLKTKIPTIIETPISFNLENLIMLENYIRVHDLKLGVIEQWPYLPLECFKREVIESGALGKVCVVENDYRTYDYHGIAQLRRYLSTDSPLSSIQVTQSGYIVGEHYNTSGEVGETTDHWRIITAKYLNGQMLINKYSSIYKKTLFRIANGLRIYGTHGTIMAGCLIGSLLSGEKDFKFSMLDSGGSKASHDLSLRSETESLDGVKVVRNISIEVPGGPTIRWANPYTLGEHQTGIAFHLERMIKVMEGKENSPLYTISDIIKDFKIMYGIKF